MKTRIIFSINILYLFFGTVVNAQSGHIVLDSNLIQGYLLDRGEWFNSRQIEFSKIKGKKGVVYYSQDLEEYYIKGEGTYVRKTIIDGGQTKTFYFHVLSERGPKLYSIKEDKKKRFFVEKDGELIELKKDKSFEPTLQSVLNNCKEFEESVPLIRPNKTSLTRAFALHNSCYKGLLPRVRAGINIGYSNRELVIFDLASVLISMGKDPGFLVGGFMEFPIGTNPRISGVMQVNYYKNSYQTIQLGMFSRYDISVNTTSVDVPILLKYSSVNRKYKSYGTFGTTISTYLEKEGVITVTSTKTPPEPTYIGPFNRQTKNELYASFGVGIEYSIRPQNAIGLEFRYNGGIGLGNPQHQKVSALQVITSVYF